MDDFINKNDLVISGRCGLADYLFVLQKNIITLHAITNQDDSPLAIAHNNFARWESFSQIKKSHDEFGEFFVEDIRVSLSDGLENNTSIIEKVL